MWLPPAEEYGPWWMFRDTLSYTIMGVPLLIPLFHLAFEAIFRNAADEESSMRAGLK
ncbi:MAG: hypothetical protein ABI411_05440 [Tahibacter sp.]